MAGKKKAKEDHGVYCNFRMKKKQIKRLEEHADNYKSFTNRSEVIRWCVDLGDKFLSGDMENIFPLMEEFIRAEVSTEDPRQKDIFEEKRIQVGITMRDSYLQGKKQMKKALTQ
jgi:uncharacterized protein related to proFAR isomerase